MPRRKPPPPQQPKPLADPRAVDAAEDPAGHLQRQRTNKVWRARNLNQVNGVLKGVLKDLRLVSRLRQRRLHAAWAVALTDTPEELAHTRIVRLARGHLTVEVDSAARLLEYTRYHKTGLIERLSAELQNKPPIIDIHFTLGTFIADDPPRPDQRVSAP